MVKVSLAFLSNTARFLDYHLLRFSWLGLTLVFSLHFSTTWLLMVTSGEDHLASFTDWIYFFVTTATTIGYGDMTPFTSRGRMITSLVIMPGAVLLFAAFLGKLSTLILTVWKKGMHGTADYSYLHGHTVIIGWHFDKTPKMIELIFGDKKREQKEILICTSKNIENPCPERAKFVRANKITDHDVLQRTAIVQASRIIIYRATDDQTLATCLAVGATSTRAHVVAWFEDSGMVQLVRAHCPNVEFHTNITTELLVRSAQDPGSSRIQDQLLSVLKGPTQYSVQVPLDFPGTEFGTLLMFLKKKHEAIALGIADSAVGENMRLNPAGNSPVVAGQIIYFMASVRICSEDIDWHEMITETI